MKKLSALSCFLFASLSCNMVLADQVFTGPSTNPALDSFIHAYNACRASGDLECTPTPES